MKLSNEIFVTERYKGKDKEGRPCLKDGASFRYKSLETLRREGIDTERLSSFYRDGLLTGYKIKKDSELQSHHYFGMKEDEIIFSQIFFQQDDYDVAVKIYNRSDEDNPFFRLIDLQACGLIEPAAEDIKSIDLAFVETFEPHVSGILEISKKFLKNESSRDDKKSAIESSIQYLVENLQQFSSCLDKIEAVFDGIPTTQKKRSLERELFQFFAVQSGYSEPTGTEIKALQRGTKT